MFKQRRLFIVSLSTLVLVSMFAARPQVTSIAAQGGQVVADTGFRPDKNGFSFQNYSNSLGYTNLTAADVRRLFGDTVCDQINGDTCVLSSTAQAWMDDINTRIGGGHCDGFATLSDLLYQQNPEVASQFGADQTPNLKIAGNDQLQREIAYWWATQTLSPTLDGKMANFKILLEPSDVVKKFIDDTNSKAETYTLYIAQPDWTHAHVVTPYEAIDKGNGLYWLMVYDNNYPKQERHIEVDTVNQTWNYSTAANPDDSATGYSGTDNPMTMTLVPNSLRLQTQICPFCGTQSTKAAGPALDAIPNNEIWLNDQETASSDVHLLITDAQGNKLGYDNGKLVNEIPGAMFDIIGSDNLWENDIEPLYRIPAGTAFTVTVDGSLLKQPETSSVSMIGPGYDLDADNIKLQPGESDTLQFSADGKMLAYTPSASESPDFSIGTKHSDVDYAFEVKGFEVDKGAAVQIDLEYDKGQLDLHTTGNSNPSTYALEVTRTSKDDQQTYKHDGIELDPGATAFLDFGKWDGKGDLALEIDKQSDGTVDQTIDEPNQP